MTLDFSTATGYLSRMFRAFRDVADQLQLLRAVVEDATATLAAAIQDGPTGGGLEDRVGALEGSLTRHMAEAESLILKAEGKFHAARAAEERSRGKEKRAEELLASASDEEGEGPLPEWYLDQLRRGDGGGGTEEGVQPVRNGVETREETVARLRAMKLGYGR